MSDDDRTLGEKISDYICAFGGSWSFIFIALSFIALWVILNITPGGIQWDVYPFILLNLFLSLIAAFQAPFILMTQKRCERKQDMIYRMLFREIKELVETDLNLDQEIMCSNKKLEEELQTVKEMLQKLIERSKDAC